MDRQDLKEIWDFVLLILPAPIGALIGLRYATALTPRQQASNFFCSLVIGYFAGSLAGEVWTSLTHNAIALITICATAASMEVMAGLLSVAKAFSTDPFGVVGKVLDVVARVFVRRAP